MREIQKPFKKAEKILFYFLILFLPTQLGKHFWPAFSLIQGISVDYLSPTLYFTDILIFLLFLFWLLRNLLKQQEKQNAKRKTKKNKFYPIFVCFLLLTIFLSNNYLNGLYHLIKFFEFSFVFYYVARTVKKQKQLLQIIFFLSICVIGESLLAIAQFIKQASLGGLFYFFGERAFTGQTPGIANASIDGLLILRPYGTFPHPNVLAGFLVCVMTLAFFSKSVAKGTQKAVIIAGFLIGTGALLLTMSRVSIVLWFLVLVVSVLHFQSFHQQRLTNVIKNQWIGILFLGIFLCGIIVSPVGTRLLHTNPSEQSVREREELVTATMTMIYQHPFIGVGLGNYLPTLAVQKKHPVLRNLYLQPVHTIFLLVFAETGFAGFLFFLFFLIKTYQHITRNKVFLFVLTFMLILGLLDHYWITLQQGQLFFSVFLGLCWTQISNQESNKKSPVLPHEEINVFE